MSKNIVREAVITVPLHSLKTFENYPFLMHEDDSMAELVSSIKEHGVSTPLTVMPTDDGGFEIISGHRRKRAAELLGLKELPVIVRHLSREEAIVEMVDSNIHRKELLPSEKSKAYAMKYNAIKRSAAGRPTIDESSDKETGRSRDILASSVGESSKTVARYIKMGELIPELMKMVDERKIKLTPAFELAHLKPEEQKAALESIETEGSPTLSQAQRLRSLSEKGLLNDDAVFKILSEQKKPESFNVVIPVEKLKKYFPRAASPKEIEEKLLALCERLYQQQMARKHGNER